VVLRDAGVNLGDDFFYDVQSCSDELANLKDIRSLSLPFYCHFLFLFPYFFGSLVSTK